ncbi:hypothetical protein FACS1894190_04520 [Spirochaetia bacterium]|nr:hypothetical protein FACS1894190_04520 [Spirochaetia bacterium]
MSITYLDISKNIYANTLIDKCKSDSHINGVELRNVHYRLGCMLAHQIAVDLNNRAVTVIIIMRAGLCFGMGISNELENIGIKPQILFYFDNNQWEKEKSNCLQALNNDILIVDSVINSGNSIIKFAQGILNNQKILFATNVISENALKKFYDRNIYAVRKSNHSFIGSKNNIVINNNGPDTGDRLFNTK